MLKDVIMRAKNSNVAIVTLSVFILFVGVGLYYILTSYSSSPNPMIGAGWARSGHNDQSDKYSPLVQVNKQNVKNLKLAWEYKAGGKPGPNNSIQTNPIYADGLIFTTYDHNLIAINAKDGSEVWKLKFPASVGKRGITYHEGNIYVPTSNGVHVVRAKTGKLNTSMGKDGVFGDKFSKLPPIVSGNQLIVANFLYSVESWNIETGEKNWDTSFSKDNIDPRLWSGVSYDKKNNLVFVVTSNSMNFFAKNYKDGYASSLVALNAENGEIAWQFQELRREIWDLDMVGPPIVTEITRDGKKIPVVVAVSKTGNTILVKRKTGQSIFGFEYQDVPQSDIEGEITADQQMVISRPEPYADVYFDLEKDVTRLSKEKRDYVLHKLRNAKSAKLMPVSLSHDVVMFGLNGGAMWPGAAVDNVSGTLIVPSNRYPFILRAEYVDKKPKFSKEIAQNDAVYTSKCGSCHGAGMEGSIDWGMGDRFNSPLIGITKRRTKEYLTSIANFETDHRYAAKNNPKEAGALIATISGDDLVKMYDLFVKIDQNIEGRNDYSYRGTYQYLYDVDGQFGSNPPWGYLTAINLNNGKTKWRIPFGEVYEEQTGETYQGDINLGGVVVTAGGIVLANGTRDSKARAFDVDTGDLLWEVKLPATGSSPPTTFEMDGCQYVVFTATGGVRFKNYSDSTVAYKLPACEAK